MLVGRKTDYSPEESRSKVKFARLVTLFSFFICSNTESGNRHYIKTVELSKFESLKVLAF
jgi:hypothetical protein